MLFVLNIPISIHIHFEFISVYSIRAINHNTTIIWRIYNNDKYMDKYIGLFYYIYFFLFNVIIIVETKKGECKNKVMV